MIVRRRFFLFKTDRDIPDCENFMIMRQTETITDMIMRQGILIFHTIKLTMNLDFAYKQT